MQEFNHRQSKIDFELTNNFNNVERTFVNLHNDRILTMHQIICLLEYKYLSQNAKYNKNDIGYELNENLTSCMYLIIFSEPIANPMRIPASALDLLNV